jgi:hypothetical protein
VKDGEILTFLILECKLHASVQQTIILHSDPNECGFTLKMVIDEGKSYEIHTRFLEWNIMQNGKHSY